MSRFKVLCNQSGFSLIEGLMVMGLMGAAVVGYMTYSKNVAKQDTMTNLRRSIAQIKHESGNYFSDSRSCGDSVMQAFEDLRASSIDSTGQIIQSSNLAVLLRNLPDGPKVFFEAGVYAEPTERILVKTVQYTLEVREMFSTPDLEIEAGLQLDITLESCGTGGRHAACEGGNLRSQVIKHPNNVIFLKFNSSGQLADANCSPLGGGGGGGSAITAQEICDQMGPNFVVRNGACVLDPVSMSCPPSGGVLVGIRSDGSPLCRNVNLNDIPEFRSIGSCVAPRVIVLRSNGSTLEAVCDPAPPSPGETCLEAMANRQSSTCQGQFVTLADGTVCGNGTMDLNTGCNGAENYCQNQTTFKSACNIACPGSKISRQFGPERELGIDEGSQWMMSALYRNYCFEPPSPGTAKARYIRECRESLPSSSRECDDYATGPNPCRLNNYIIKAAGVSWGTIKPGNECYLY